jgi:hypothetical protein
LAPGCGYTLRAPYDPEITTVYVPVFRSFTFRPEQNLELTRMVQQEIIKRTPFKVVDSPEGADTVLAGTILFTSKNVWVNTPQNFPRNITAELTAEVTWEDVRPTADPTEEPPKVRVVRFVYFYPEAGETAQLGFTRAMQQIAADIVNMMEKPW